MRTALKLNLKLNSNRELSLNAEVAEEKCNDRETFSFSSLTFYVCMIGLKRSDDGEISLKCASIDCRS